MPKSESFKSRYEESRRATSTLRNVPQIFLVSRLAGAPRSSDRKLSLDFPFPTESVDILWITRYTYPQERNVPEI